MYREALIEDSSSQAAHYGSRGAAEQTETLRSCRKKHPPEATEVFKPPYGVVDQFSTDPFLSIWTIGAWLDGQWVVEASLNPTVLR